MRQSASKEDLLLLMVICDADKLLGPGGNCSWRVAAGDEWSGMPKTGGLGCCVFRFTGCYTAISSAT